MRGKSVCPNMMTTIRDKRTWLLSLVSVKQNVGIGLNVIGKDWRTLLRQSFLCVCEETDDSSDGRHQTIALVLTNKPYNILKDG